MDQSARMSENTSGRKRHRKDSTAAETGGSSMQSEQHTDLSQNGRQLRGLTCLQVMATGAKEKKVVEWNARGQPVGDVSVKFSSTMGVIVREKVPIIIDTWHGVDGPAKENLWKLLMQKYLVDVCFKPFIMQQMGKLWRSWKSELSTQIRKIMESRSTNLERTNLIAKLRPHNVSLAEWDQFVQCRMTEKWQAKSLKMREIRAKQTLAHTLSRKGYSRKEDEHNKLHPDKPLTKPQLWIEAHLSKKKTSDANAAIIDEIQQKMDEAPNGDGEEILTHVLGKEYPGRIRGLGAGVTKTKLYAQSQRESKYAKMEAKLRKMTARCKRIEAALASKLGINLDDDDDDDESGEDSCTELQSTKGLPSAKNLQTTKDVQTTAPWEAVSNIARSYLDFPEGWSECELASSEPGNLIVATGKVFNTHGMQPVMLHNKPLEPGYMKVTIIDSKVQNAPLPMPTDEAYTVFEAVGAFVAWPTDLIFRNTTELELPSGCKDVGFSKQNESTVSKTLAAPVESQSAPLEIALQSAAEINDNVNSTKEFRLSYGKKDKGMRKQIKRAHPKVPVTAPITEPATAPTSIPRPSQSNQAVVHQQKKLTTLTMKLMYRCARGMSCDDTVTIDMPPTVWLREHNILINKDELLQWLFQENVQASHISICIKYLFNLCQEWGVSQMFVCLRPQMLSPDTHHAEDEEVQYVANAMKGANRNQIYFAPYTDGKHWMLCAVNPVKDQAYWLDPAGNEVHPDAKKVVQMAIRKFYSHRRRKKPRRQTQWFEIKCPRQANEEDCGYYVLRYMYEIIEKRQDSIPEQYYEDSPAPGAYEQHHIDEIRDKWVEFVQNHMD